MGKYEQDQSYSPRLYIDLIEASQDLFWQCDTEGRYIYLNNEWETVLGYSLNEMMGRPFTDFQSEEAGARDMQTFVELLEGRSVKGYRTVLNTRHGTEVHLSFNAKPLFDADGTLLGTLGTAQDITAQLAVERALAKNEKRFRSLFMSISDGFYLSEVLDNEQGIPDDYRFVEVNPQFEKILGLQRNEIIGRRYREIVPVDTTAWMDNYRKVAQTGRPSTYEFYSGEYQKYFETYAYKTDDRQITVFVRDVTEKKNTEAALQKVQKLESLGILAGGIAHDFNNLLSAIYANIDLARESTAPNDATLRYLNTAMSSFVRAQSLTRQLLTFAKGGEPTRTVGSLRELLKQTATFALSGANVSCSFNISGDLLDCAFDSAQIAQVVDNLVINAVQAMPEGGHLTISAENVRLQSDESIVLPEGDYVRTTVADTGAGIPPDIQPKIFDPFFTTKPTGTGLGLATAHSIVSKHGGAITVSSRPGDGTEFIFYLPIAIPRRVSALPPTEPANNPSGNGRILVMDDDEVLQKVFRRMLESFGYTVDTVVDGDAALQRIKDANRTDRPVTAALLDLTIPSGMSGKDCIVHVRHDFPFLPVFVASGYSDDPVMADPNAFGFTDKIQKPFLKKDLAELLARYRL